MSTDEAVDRVRAVLARSGDRPTPSRVVAALRAEGIVVGDHELLRVSEAVRADMVGLGPLEHLLAQPGVTDVMINGPGEVWFDDGQGLHRSTLAFDSSDAVRRFAQRLAAAAGRRLDDASPYVDARLAGGIRLHAVLPPVAPEGPLVSLRLAPRHSFELSQLVALGWTQAEAAQWLRRVLTARLSFLVTGGTGSGKTTVLSSLLSLAHPAERIVLVEDSGELSPQHPHVVRLEARPPNIEGAGAVGLDVLVRQALRMRPDRIVVGEVRGREVVDLLAALNTGHEGSCGTLHANRSADVPARLEALGTAAGLDRTALHSQLAAALDVVLHVERRGGERRLASIDVVVTGRDGFASVVPALLTAGGSLTSGPGLDVLASRLTARGVAL